MNRRILTLGTGVLALAAFGGGAWLYSRGDLAGPIANVEDDVYVRPHSPVIGNPDARVTIVEFFDPSCEACRAFHPILKEILSRHREDLRIVLRYTPFHQGSDEAVRILEAARRQNLFDAVLDVLMLRQPEWAEDGAPKLENAWRFAGEAGLDLQRARQDGFHPSVDRALEIDLSDIRTLEVRRTPTFFVNKRPLVSFGPQQLYELVLSEIRASR